MFIWDQLSITAICRLITIFYMVYCLHTFKNVSLFQNNYPQSVVVWKYFFVNLKRSLFLFRVMFQVYCYLLLVNWMRLKNKPTIMRTMKYAKAKSILAAPANRHFSISNLCREYHTYKLKFSTIMSIWTSKNKLLCFYV